MSNKSSTFVQKLKLTRSVIAKRRELNIQKQRDFAKNFNEMERCLRAQGLDYNITTICEMVAALPAPRFYVDVNEALLQYRDYRNGRSHIRGIERRKMYAEIFSRFERQMNALIATGQRAVQTRVMQNVLEQEAPSFYYERNTAAKTYYREMLMARRMKRL